MDFADSYFEDEIREGFYVPSIMKKAWAAQLEVLSVIHEICRKNNIQYFAEFGTLLGAIRHGGMIPWDDDFDICMMGEEYNKFLSVLDELPHGYIVSDFHFEDTDNMVIKIKNSDTLFASEETLKEHHGFPFVAGVDIFRLDYLPPKENEQVFYRQLIILVTSVVELINGMRKKEEDMDLPEQKLEEYLKQIEKLYKTKINRNASIKEQLYHLVFERLSLIYDKREASEVTMLAQWCNNSAYKMPKDCYSDSIELPFENMQIKIPVGYEKLLQIKYGQEYIKPIRDCDSHQYPYFKNGERYLFTKSPLEYYPYKVNRDIILSIEQEYRVQRQNKKKTIKEQAKEFLPLLSEAHKNIVQLLNEEQLETVYLLIGDCQDTAVHLGNLIEDKYGENHKTVHMLEQYCEMLFQIYQNLQKSEEKNKLYDVVAISEKLDIFIKVLDNNFEQELKSKKEVVFIPYKSSYWSSMESVWKAAEDAEDTDVYVIPAPYYFKDSLGKIKKEEMQYEGDGYPVDVKITSYEKYNFEIHHPDIIVIQCPYDEFNYAMSLHPFFYASNLKKYTEQLIYIPALAMDEIMDGDERAKTMLKYYCNTPGVVNADKVIVQSEQMKKVYVELLTEFAGEDTKEIWERKIFGLGSPVFDCSEEKKVFPEEWKTVLQKPDGNWKKIILYSTSASALLCHGEKMIKKMKEVFQMFWSCRDDVALVWRPDSKARDVLRKEHPGLWQAYRDLTQSYREEAWGIYDDSTDMKRAVFLCDAGYGDGGIVMNACRCQKKPVMIQKVI